MTPQELQKVLDELEASRSSRRRAWENLQELRWVLQDSAGMKLPPPAKKTIDQFWSISQPDLAVFHGYHRDMTLVILRELFLQSRFEL
jgi:hypothetical protein